MNEEFVKALEIEVRREEEEFRELANDLQAIKELNTNMSIIYEDVMRSFPRVAEIDYLLSHFETFQEKKIVPKDVEAANKMCTYLESLTEEQFKQRVFQLKRFRSALVMLEKNDPRLKPKRYEDLDL